MYYKETPSIFEMKFINKNLIPINEGDAISFKMGNQKMFFGYIFTINIQHNYIYTIKAYDQIRYLITRDTYIYYNKSASEIIEMICNDFNLKMGIIENTNYIIPYRIEENQPILDIIYTALEITKKTNGKDYLFFDDFGQICLKKYENMKTGVILDLTTNSIEYKIEKSIDKDVYNSIKLSIKNKKTKIISTFKKDDYNSKLKWGTLRYFERLPNTFSNFEAESYAQNILNLKYKNKFKILLKTKGLTNIRAGSILTILDGNEKRDMLIQKCTHTIANNEHIMNLILIDF